MKKHLHSRPAALAALWERDIRRDEWEIIEEVQRLHQAGDSVHAGLQRVFNEIMLAAAQRGKLPTKRRGIKARTDHREIDSAIAYLKAKRQGRSSDEATRAASKVFPKEARQIARYVKEHRSIAERFIATDAALEIAIKEREITNLAIAEIYLLERQQKISKDEATECVHLIIRVEALRISELDHLIENTSAAAHRAAHRAHRSAQSEDPVITYSADLRYAADNLSIDIWEMRARRVLRQRAARFENHVTVMNQQRLAQLEASVTARISGDH